MGAGVHRSDAYAAGKFSGRKDKRVGLVEISFNLVNRARRDVNIDSRRDGDTHFKFLGRDTAPLYVDNRRVPAPGNPELRNYRAVFVVVADQEVSQFSEETTANCTPLV
jgi:hypothetical protein